MRDGIVITGMGVVTPVGIGVDTYWENLTAGVCGIGEITQIDTTALPIHRAAEVHGFHPKDFMPTRLALDLEPYQQYAYAAAEQALAQSGLQGSARVGVVMATALHGLTIITKTQTRIDVRGQSAEPKLLTKCMGNLAACQFSIMHQITGPSLTVSTACSSGGDAITMGTMLLRSGMADAVVVMAGEAAICPAFLQSLDKVGALSATGESRPFDVTRNGFVTGEGGGALILETESAANARGAKPLARLLGAANNTDAYHPVSPAPNGAGAAACIRLALADAGLTPEGIDYLNAHGTATVKGDIAEACAIRAVFGDLPVTVSSTKGATGHMMGAGGLTEVITCVQAIRTGLLPPSLGLTEQQKFSCLAIHAIRSVRKMPVADGGPVLQLLCLSQRHDQRRMLRKQRIHRHQQFRRVVFLRKRQDLLHRHGLFQREPPGPCPPK